MPIAAEHAFKEKSAKLLILLPLRTISKRTFQCEIPCIFGQTLLGIVTKLCWTKSLLTKPSNVLPLHLKPTFPLIIWIFTEGEAGGIESRLPLKIFSTLKVIRNVSLPHRFYSAAWLRHRTRFTSLTTRTWWATFFKRPENNSVNVINMSQTTLIFHPNFFCNRWSKQSKVKVRTHGISNSKSICRFRSLRNKFQKFKNFISFESNKCSKSSSMTSDIASTGYSLWDRLRNFLHKFTWIVLSFHYLNKLGRFW